MAKCPSFCHICWMKCYLRPNDVATLILSCFGQSNFSMGIAFPEPSVLGSHTFTQNQLYQFLLLVGWKVREFQSILESLSPVDDLEI